MRHSTNYLNRERLEVIFGQSGQKQAKKTESFLALKRIWFFLQTILTKGNELQVWQTSDHGNTWWNAYDPATDRSISHASETEMRVWIEKRYYQR